MAKHYKFHFSVAIILSFLILLVEGGCDETPVGIKQRSKIRDSQLISSTNFDSNTPASNGRLDYTAGSSWCASSRDSTPYLQIDLGSVFIICGVATQGNSKADHWVKTYQVQYSIDGTNWKEYRKNGLVKTFQGNYDRSTVVKRFFFEAVEARYVVVLPTSHYNRICIRFELYGVTKQVCSRSAVGISDRSKVPDYRFSASSIYGRLNLPSKARLNMPSQGWAPERKKKANSWLQVDLGNSFIICAIATQGSHVFKEWVKKYKVKLSTDGESWQYYRENSVVKVFDGNTDKGTVKKNELTQVATAKLFEEWPTEYHNYPTIRLEIYGVAQGCRSSLGIERRSVYSSQLTSSSGTASDGRLYKTNTAWCSPGSSNTEYLQVDLKNSVTITGVATQGHPTRQQWVKTFTIKYSFDNFEWFDFKDDGVTVRIFSSITSHGKIKINWFRRSLVARYVRIFPQTWQQSACLRFDLYGCKTVNSPQVNAQGAAAVSGTGAFTKVEVTLECRARGQPSPNIKWSNRSRDLTNQATLTRTDGFTYSNLTFQVQLSLLISQFNCQNQSQSSKVVRCSWNSYECIASYPETHGGARSSAHALLSVNLNIPSPVKNLKVSEVKARSVIISWNTPDPGHAQITSYKLWYWISSFSGPPVNIKSNVNQYELIGFTPYRDYLLMVIIKAVSIVGEGPQARMDQQFKTKEAAPSEPGNLYFSQDSTKPRLTLQWLPPRQPNGVIKGYTLYYRYLPDGVVTKAVIMDPTTKRITVNVIGGLTYNFSISATTGEEGPRFSRLKTIQEYKPEASPTNLTFRHVNASIYNCSWIPPPREKSHGKIIGYDVRYNAKSSTRKKRSVAYRYTRKPYALLTGLKVCNFYEVSVRAATSKGAGPYGKNVRIENAAVPPTNITATITDKTFVTIKWAEPAELGSSIQGYRSFSDKSEDYISLFPATDYEFKVATKAGCTGLVYTDQLKVTTKIDNPPRPNITKVEDISGTSTQISIRISPASSRNGPISFYQVIVLRSDNEEERMPKDSESNLTNFNEAAAKNITFYIAFVIPAENVTVDSRFTVGDGKMYGSYLNAKLQEGKRYIVFVRAISKENKVIYAGEYSMVAKVSVKRKSTNGDTAGNSAPAIAAGVITACVIVAVIIFAVIFIRRRKSKGRSKIDSSESMKLQRLAVQHLSTTNPNLVHEEEAGYEEVVYKQGATTKSKKTAETDGVENVVLPSAPSLSACAMEPVAYSNVLEDSHHQPIPVVQFSEYMNRVKGANYARLRQEYNALSKEKQFPWEVAEKPENKKLNRFANIIAYDHSRVPVEPAGGVEYINANYIEGWDGTAKVYIATQGPNTATFSIFWLMVWNEQVGSIVMINNIVENGKTQCDQYWPESTANYGAIKVSLHEVEAFADFTIRTFILSKNSESRTVNQFHFAVWPDRGVPRMATNILSLRRRVRSATAPDMGPVLVHCSNRWTNADAIKYSPFCSYCKVAGQLLTIANERDSEVQRTMLELLNQLDGFEATKNIKVVMATNRIDILDNALLRPGRIDRKIEFPPPNEEARLDILKIHSRKMNLTRGINLRKIAELMPGASGAEVKGVCTEAGMYALRERRVHVTQEDFEMAVAKVMQKDSEKNMSLKKQWK